MSLPLAATCVNSVQIAASKRKHLATRFAELGDVVYFLRHGEHVKIGHSIDLRQRLYQHRAKPTDLLLVMAGGAEVEREMHARFAHLRAEGEGLGVEHFHPEPELVEFINARRQAMGLPTV